MLEHTDSERVGSPTGRGKHNCDSAREEILRPIQEGVEPEKMSARRVALQMRNR